MSGAAMMVDEVLDDLAEWLRGEVAWNQKVTRPDDHAYHCGLAHGLTVALIGIERAKKGTL